MYQNISTAHSIIITTGAHELVQSLIYLNFKEKIVLEFVTLFPSASFLKYCLFWKVSAEIWNSFWHKDFIFTTTIPIHLYYKLIWSQSVQTDYSEYKHGNMY